MSGKKPFRPSKRKLKEARDRGDVAKSSDLSASLLFAVGVPSSIMVLFIECYSGRALSLPEGQGFPTDSMLVYARYLAVEMCSAFGPWLALLLSVGVFAEIAQSGIVFSFESVRFDLSRLNPLKGFSKMLGIGEDFQHQSLPKLLVEVVKKTTLVILLMICVSCFLCYALSQLLAQHVVDVDDAVLAAASQLLSFTGIVALLLIIFSVVGYFIAKERYLRRLGMDVHELKEESRRMEGNPECKAMRKEQHRQLLMNAAVQSIRQAKVVLIGRDRD